MSLREIECRISNALVSNAKARSAALTRVAALEQLLRMIRETSKEPEVHRLVELAFPAVDAQKIVDGFMDYHGRKTTKTNPDCPACERGHGLLGSGCICGSTSDRGGKHG